LISSCSHPLSLLLFLFPGKNSSFVLSFRWRRPVNDRLRIFVADRENGLDFDSAGNSHGIERLNERFRIPNVAPAAINSTRADDRCPPPLGRSLEAYGITFNAADLICPSRLNEHSTVARRRRLLDVLLVRMKILWRLKPTEPPIRLTANAVCPAPAFGILALLMLYYCSRTDNGLFIRANWKIRGSGRRCVAWRTHL